MLGKKNSLRYLFILLVIAFSANLSAQVNINSPYSRFAIGEIYKSTDPTFMAMGGMSLAYRSPNVINYLNPASYTSFDSLSFVFQAGINSSFITLKNAETDSKTNYTSLSYLIFGFPVNRWWRSSLGLLPYSKVGYDIKAVEYQDDLGNIAYTYDGSGGVNRVYWGNGFQVNKNLSLGFNFSYLFGNIEKSRAVSFPDSIYRFSTQIVNTTHVSDLFLDYGLQYTRKLNNDLMLQGGLVFSNSMDINTTETQIASTFVTSSDGSDYIKDTVDIYPESFGHIVLPTSFGIGIILKKSQKWLVGVDYYWQNWNKYTSQGKKDSLDNSMQISIGTQFTPSNTGISKYWERIDYRFGLKYGKSYVELNNNQLKKFGISFGFGLPLKRSKTKLNFAIEYGQTGTLNKNLIQSNYVQFSFDIAIYERWFFKKKYD